MPDHQTIQDYLQNKLDYFLGLHRQMVAINSFTSNPSGVDKLGQLTAEIFASLGFTAEAVPSTNLNYGKHLFLVRTAADQIENVAVKAIAMISHLDTVFPPDEEIKNDFFWRREGNRISGPGVVDIKGGTVMMFMVLDAIKTYFRDSFDRISWFLCFDASEETLSEDFGRFCKERLPKETLACLVFEGGNIKGEAFQIVTARKGRATFRVSVEGKSAHAGNNHANGANAIVQMSHTVQKIAALTDYDKQLTFNVGTVHGGVVINRVPHHAEADVEMRTFSPEVFETGAVNMLALDGSSQVSSQDGFACKVHVELQERTAPWPRNDGTDTLFEIWQNTAESLGIQVCPEERGGLSDGNYLWQTFPTLDGLGPAGNHAHCSERDLVAGKDQEYVLVSSFVPKALLNIYAIVELLKH